MYVQGSAHEVEFPLTAGEWKILAASGGREKEEEENRERGGESSCARPSVIFDIDIFLLLRYVKRVR
jgi:hypothetical protein